MVRVETGLTNNAWKLLAQGNHTEKEIMVQVLRDQGFNFTLRDGDDEFEGVRRLRRFLDRHSINQHGRLMQDGRHTRVEQSSSGLSLAGKLCFVLMATVVTRLILV